MSDNKKIVQIIKKNEDDDNFSDYIKFKTNCSKVYCRSEKYTHMDSYRLVFRTDLEARDFVNSGSFIYKDENIHPIAMSPSDSDFNSYFSKFRK